jgi:PAS domain S-box-containing protein
MSRDVNQSYAHLAAIVESAEDAIVGIDLADQIVSWNRGAKKIYGYSALEAIGKSFASLVDGDATLESMGDRFSTQPTSPSSITQHRHRDGGAIEVILSVSAIKDATGEIIGKSIIAKRLPHTSARLQSQEEWISIVSHELRTPLTSIRGALGLLLTGKLGALPPKGQRMLEIAVSNSDRLLRLVNDLLDLQRLQVGKWVLQKKPCHLLNLMQEAAEVMQPLADKTDIKILLSQSPVLIEADPDRLYQLIVNLLSNAIKFSPPNSEISLSATLETPRSDTVLLEVQDRGRGIPIDKLELIFDSFQQVDPTDFREKQGTGLGLAICRSIVQQHQGQVWVESKLGEGSIFYVRLPIA